MRKAYLLFQRRVMDFSAKDPKLVIISEKEMSLGDIATLVGGRAYGEIHKTIGKGVGLPIVVFEKSLFGSCKNPDDSESGRLLEYQKGSLCIHISPEEMWIDLFVEEIPFMKVEE